MIDALRRDAWPRGVRRQRRELEAAREELRRELGPEPSLADLAAARRLRRKAPRPHDRPHQHDRIDVAALGGRERRRRDAAGRRWCPSEPTAPDRAYEELEVRDRVRAAIASLPPRERKVIGLYYYGEVTMKQIGAEIGVNESRVSQLHARAIQRLRKALGADVRRATHRGHRRSSSTMRACDGAGGDMRDDRARSCRKTAPPTAARCGANVAAAARRRLRAAAPRGSARAASLVSDRRPQAERAQADSPALRRASRCAVRSRSPQPERLGEPAAAGLFEEPLRVGAGDVAGHEDDAARQRSA